MSEFLQHFAFANPAWLFLLLALPPLFFLQNRRGSDSGIGFPSLSILSSVGRPPRERPGGVVFWLLCLALLAAILGLARPQWRNEYVARNASGIDILIALDVSRSMDILDFYPNDDRGSYPKRRIDAAKDVIESFIRQRPDDRVGMIVFGVRPYSLAPITLNHDWVINNLKTLRIGDIDPAGTAVGSAIAASSTRLTEREAKSKIVVLVTDGASNSGKLDPIQSAELAAKLGIRVYTVGIGTETGRLPTQAIRDPRQEFDVSSLKEIASMTGAEFFRAKTTGSLRDTFNSINNLERSEAKSHIVVDARELYPWFLGLTFLLAFFAVSMKGLNPPPMP